MKIYKLTLTEAEIDDVWSYPHVGGGGVWYAWNETDERVPTHINERYWKSSERTKWADWEGTEHRIMQERDGGAFYLFVGNYEGAEEWLTKNGEPPAQIEGVEVKRQFWRDKHEN